MPKKLKKRADHNSRKHVIKEQPQIRGDDSRKEFEAEALLHPNAPWHSIDTRAQQWHTGQINSGRGWRGGDKYRGAYEGDPNAAATTYEYGNDPGMSKGYGEEGDYEIQANKMEDDRSA